MTSHKRHVVSNHPSFDCFLTAYAEPHQRDLKVRITGPLWEEFIDDRWIPHTKASNAEKASIWWRHHDFVVYIFRWRWGVEPMVAQFTDAYERCTVYVIRPRWKPWSLDIVFMHHTDRVLKQTNNKIIKFWVRHYVAFHHNILPLRRTYFLSWKKCAQRCMIFKIFERIF